MSEREREDLARLARGISKINEARRLFEEARADIGACKICDREASVLATASGDLASILELAKETIEKSTNLSGLKELHPLAKNLRQMAGEASGSDEIRLLPVRPTELLEFARSARQGNGSNGGSSMSRPPLPHELLGLPLPGKLIRESQ